MNLEEMLLRDRDRSAPNPLAGHTDEIIALVRRRRRVRAAAGGAASVVTAAVVAVVAWQVVAPGPLEWSATTDPPTTAATAAPAAPSSTASTAPPSSSTASPIDTTTWTTFSSDRYGFSIGHPADWTVLPAEHDWTAAADADQLPSPGHESFLSPTGDLGVSAWSVPAEPGTTIEETPESVEAWAEQYCQLTSNHPCTGIAERAVALCNESRDCHPGLLVPFDDDVQAFFTGGNYQDAMVVVAVWRPETHPTVEQYGGSRRLLEAFLSTMDVSVRR